MSKPTVSIAVPVHEMKNWQFFLTRLLDSIEAQTFRDFEVVISDDATSEEIRRIIHTHPLVPIKYVRRTDREAGMARNTNEAIKNCEGEYIKILYLDDYFSKENSLESMVNVFNDPFQWLIVGTNDNLEPHMTSEEHLGNNHLGSPSALMFKNNFEHNVLFDENLSWLLDGDLYKRIIKNWGFPAIMHGDFITIGKGDHQMTNILTDEEKLAEHKYITEKYGKYN